MLLETKQIGKKKINTELQPKAMGPIKYQFGEEVKGNIEDVENAVPCAVCYIGNAGG